MAPRDEPAAARGCPIETIVQAYLTTTDGDARLALRCAVTDAVAELLDAERHTRRESRLISRGYVRATVDDAPEKA